MATGGRGDAPPDWFADLKHCLASYYVREYPADIVGYLQGSGSPETWRNMATRGRHQMLILGNVPPTREEWEAAGVAQRGAIQTLTIDKLAGWIVLYGGFIYRPWGHLFEVTDKLRTEVFPRQLDSWVRNDPKRRGR